MKLVRRTLYMPREKLKVSGRRAAKVTRDGTVTRRRGQLSNCHIEEDGNYVSALLPC
jgi:hypothetical protein